jgi:hypothetical protein
MGILVMEILDPKDVISMSSFFMGSVVWRTDLVDILEFIQSALGL